MEMLHAWLWLGTCHTALSAHQDALKCFANAVFVAGAAFGKESQPYAGALSKQCTALSAMGQVDEALKVGFQAAQIVGTLFGKESSDYGECLYAIGRVYLDKKEVECAKQFFLKSRALINKEDSKYGVLLSDLALAYQCLDEIPHAFETLKDALQLERDLHGDHHPQTSLARMNLAVLHYRMKDFQNALLLYEEALAVRTASFGINHIYTMEAALGVSKTKQMMEHCARDNFLSDKRVCALCSSISIKLSKCSKCKVAYYCDAECQQVMAIP